VNVAPALIHERSLERYSAEGPVEPPCDSTRTLLRIFETLERAGIAYCVLHGYERISRDINSDVDCILARSNTTTPRNLLALFRANRDRIGADVVRQSDYYFVFAGRKAEGAHFFLALDFAFDCDVDHLPLYGGSEILAARRRYASFHVPAPHIEFGCLLARAIAKEALPDERTVRLSELFKEDPARCAAEVARYWSGVSVDFILSAARCGDWTHVRRRLPMLRSGLRLRAIHQHWLRFAANIMRGLAGRISRLLRPQGISVAFLGPDGAGKSSAIDTLGPKLSMVFPRRACRALAPDLLSILRPAKRSTSQPHGLPPRSLAVSLLKLVFWFAYHTSSRVTLRIALARCTLVLYDRHFVDILVDQKRYRYGGPVWMLRVLWQLMPKPDLIVLLDAPAEVLQTRKQEVPFEVTERQREAYLALVLALPNGRVVDATASAESVANTVIEIILKWSAARA